jgi:hypothetical protein
MTDTHVSFQLRSLRQALQKVPQDIWRILLLSAFVLLVSYLFTRLCLLESFSHGRLAASPSYDDIEYFYKGAKVLDSIRNGNGVSALTDSLHSPYSVILACASFAIWGGRDWAPYAGNMLVVVCYLALLLYFLRKLFLGVQMGLLAIFLSLPFATMAVVEFRPDILWATLVGFVAVYQATACTAFSSRVEAFALGALYGLAMMTKPSTFLMTTAVVGLGGLLRVLRGVADRELIPSRFFTWLSLFLLALLAVAGPYYTLHFKDIWSYFYDNSFGVKKDIWISRQTLSEHLGHYIDSQNASTSNLGKWRWPILLFAGTGTVVGLVGTKQRGKRLIFASLAALMIATWLASSLFGMKSPFLGGAFYGTLIFGCAYLAAEALECCRTFLSRTIIQTGVFAGLVGFAVAMYSWPAYSEWGASRASFYSKANNGVWKAVRAVWKEYLPADGIFDIYYTNSSPIPPTLLCLRALQKGIPLDVHSGCLSESMERQRVIFNACDILIVQDSGLVEVNPNFPGEKLQTQITEEVLSRPDFELVRRIILTGEKHIYILRNKGSLIGRGVSRSY